MTQDLKINKNNRLELLKKRGINDYIIQKMDEQNYKTIEKDKINGLFYSGLGACGEPGLTMVVLEDFKILYNRMTDGFKKNQIEIIASLFEGFNNGKIEIITRLLHADGKFNPYKECHTTMNNADWVCLYLGLGNHLYLRSDLYKKIEDLIYPDNIGSRYYHWMNLIGYKELLYGE